MQNKNKNCTSLNYSNCYKQTQKPHPNRKTFNHINGNLYHYAGNNPVKYTDPTGLSTDVDENSGIILNAQNNGDNGVYAYPTYNGERCEGPCLLIGLTGTPDYFSTNGLIGKNIKDYGGAFVYGDFQFVTPNTDYTSVVLENSIFQSWASKKEGESLTQAESNVQMAIGGVEMSVGFAGIFFTGGTAVQAGAYVMADGAIVLSFGSQNKKCTPFLHLANDFLNPYIELTNSTAGFVSPLP